MIKKTKPSTKVQNYELLSEMEQLHVYGGAGGDSDDNYILSSCHITHNYCTKCVSSCGSDTKKEIDCGSTGTKVVVECGSGLI